MSQKKTITITRGQDFEFLLDLKKPPCPGSKEQVPEDITGYTFIRAFIGDDTNQVKVHTPMSAGTDEVQQIAFPSTPTSGSFKLKSDDFTTAAIAFNAASSVVAAALNALPIFSEIQVSGAISPSGLTVTFQGKDGKRAQELLEIVDNTLVDGGGAVVPSVSETTEGENPTGISVVSAYPARLQIKGGRALSKLLKASATRLQPLKLEVRISEKDLNIPPQNVVQVV